MGMASLQWVSLWEWPAFSGCPCGNGQPSVGVLVGMASLQWVSLREWPAFSRNMGVVSFQGRQKNGTPLAWPWPRGRRKGRGEVGTGGGGGISVEDASGISIVRREEGEEPFEFSIIPTGTTKVKSRGTW